MYSRATRSATTITTSDGASRWVGSQESERAVVETVLERGLPYQSIVDRLGDVYYAAFEPIRDVNGKVIGMVSVGKPTHILFEDTRKQLIVSLLFGLAISVLAAFLGYGVLSYFRKVKEEGGKLRGWRAWLLKKIGLK